LYIIFNNRADMFYVLGLGFAVFLLVQGAIAFAAEMPRFAPEALREDLHFAVAAMRRIHPEPNAALDGALLEHAVAKADAALGQPLDRDQAWAILARLNSILADGHLMIGYANWRADSAAYLKAGGTFFPFEVFLDAQGAPHIRSELGGAATTLAGARIVSINGRDAKEVAAAMLERVHGDSQVFRANLLGQRWWFYYWKMFGKPAIFSLELEGGVRLQAAPTHSAPLLLRDEDSFDRQFQFELLPGKAAMLTLKSFAWPDKKRYLAFTEDAFEQMRALGVKTLLIDIRANGGGNDDMWIDGIMRYLAGTRFRWGASYVKKVLAGRAEAGQQVGDVVHGEISTWIAPEPDNPLHFDGRVYVLTGAATYSSAILFANTVQDFAIGAVVGEGGAARSRQSGGTQSLQLPNTGLMVSVPRLVITRPSGNDAPVLFTPDLLLADPPLNPRAMVDAVLAHAAKR
jgi:hypothetical protein